MNTRAHEATVFSFRLDLSACTFAHPEVTVERPTRSRRPHMYAYAAWNVDASQILSRRELALGLTELKWRATLVESSDDTVDCRSPTHSCRCDRRAQVSPKCAPTDVPRNGGLLARFSTLEVLPDCCGANAPFHDLSSCMVALQGHYAVGALDVRHTTRDS